MIVKKTTYGKNTASTRGATPAVASLPVRSAPHRVGAADRYHSRVMHMARTVSPHRWAAAVALLLAAPAGRRPRPSSTTSTGTSSTVLWRAGLRVGPHRAAGVALVARRQLHLHRLDRRRGRGRIQREERLQRVVSDAEPGPGDEPHHRLRAATGRGPRQRVQLRQRRRHLDPAGFPSSTGLSSTSPTCPFALHPPDLRSPSSRRSPRRRPR